MQNKIDYSGKFSNNTWLNILAIFLVASIVILPIVVLGMPSGSDLKQHLQFADAYYNAISAGDFFPGWASEDNYGFGSIGIRIYPPLAYYFLAAAQMFTGDSYNALLINIFWWMFVGCVGVYFLAKEWLSPAQSVFAAAVYAIAPYHLNQIYQVFLFAEFAAMGVTPFCFLFITRLVRRGSVTDVLLFSIFYSLLILTNIPSAIIVSISLAIYVLLLSEWRSYPKVILKSAIAILLSLSATAFHLSKIITEMNWVNHNSEQFSSGHFDYQKYLFPMSLNSGDAVQQNWYWQMDAIAVLTIFLFFPVVILLAIKLWEKSKDDYRRRATTALFGTGLFALFMMSAASSFLWHSSGFLQKLQFPWRWQSAASLIAAISFSFAISFLSDCRPKLKKISVYLTILFILFVAMFNLTHIVLSSEPLSKNKFEEIIADKQRKGCSCWWTIWAVKEAFDQKEKVFAAPRTVTINQWQSESREFEIEAGEVTNARVATFYYPYWQAEINGNPIELQKFRDGTISIPLSGEKSHVRLFFREPLLIKYSEKFSLSIWALLLIGFLWLSFAKPKQTSIGELE